MRSRSSSCGIERWSISADPRAPGGDPQRLARPGAGEPRACGLPGRDRLGQRLAGHQHETPRAHRVLGVGRSVVRPAGRRPRPGVPPGGRPVGGALRVERLPEGCPLIGHVGDLDPQHEAHRVEPGDEPGGGLGEQPRRHAVVDDGREVLDMPVRAQDQQLGRAERSETGQLLRGQRVQPAEPVRSGDRDHAEVRLVDDAAPGLERALLGDGVAVVPGHTCVTPGTGDGPGEVEQRVGHPRRVIRSEA